VCDSAPEINITFLCVILSPVVPTRAGPCVPRAEKDTGRLRGWWSGVVVSALALINEVNERRARLLLRWATVSGFNSRCRTFISVYNQPATKGQLSRPSLRDQQMSTSFDWEGKGRYERGVCR